MEKLSILFESGTSKEEIQSFSNNIRQKLEGKVSGKELEDIIKKYNEDCQLYKLCVIHVKIP